MYADSVKKPDVNDAVSHANHFCCQSARVWFSHWNGLFVVYVSHMLAPLMPRVTRGPRRPPRHAWHRLAQASLAGLAAASLPSIMAAPALAMGAAEEASGSSFGALSAKMNVLGDADRTRI